jgi:hypothetical protein
VRVRERERERESVCGGGGCILASFLHRIILSSIGCLALPYFPHIAS